MISQSNQPKNSKSIFVQLLDIYDVLNNSLFVDEKKLAEYAQEIEPQLLAIFSSTNYLDQIWPELFSIRSTHIVKREFSRICNLYKLVSNKIINYFISFTFSKKFFIQSLMKSLLNFDVKDDLQLNHITDIFSDIPFDYLMALTDLFADDINNAVNCINRHFSSYNSVETLVLIMKNISNINKNNKKDKNFIYPKEIINALINKSLCEFTAIQIFDLFIIKILKYDLNEYILKVIINSFSDDFLFDLTIEISNLWSNNQFISNTVVIKQKNLTSLLLNCLEKINDPGDLTAKIKSDREPLIVILSQGVGKYLDSSNNLSRIFGMKVAKKFSSILGNEINFGELDNQISTNDVEDSIVVEEASNDSKLCKKKDNIEENEEKNKISDSENSDDEDDDNDEFKPYDLTERTNILSKEGSIFYKSKYLRGCLECTFLF